MNIWDYRKVVFLDFQLNLKNRYLLKSEVSKTVFFLPFSPYLPLSLSLPSFTVLGIEPKALYLLYHLSQALSPWISFD
jgi:hypothetical protein